MKLQKVTLSLPKELMKQVKALAKKRVISLDGFVRVALEDIINKDSEYQRARDRQIALMKTGFDLGTHGRIGISRNDIH